MPGCAAVNCTTQAKKGTRLFRFPATPRRRAKWLQNSRRANWTPTSSDRLCEVHFERSQYELYSLKEGETPKLKRTSVPTLFDVANAPKRLDIQRPPRKRPIANTEAGDFETSDLGTHRPDHNYFKKKKTDSAADEQVLSPNWEWEVSSASNSQLNEEAASWSSDNNWIVVDKNRSLTDKSCPSTSSAKLLSKKPGSPEKQHSSTPSSKLLNKKPRSAEKPRFSTSSPKLLNKKPRSAEKPRFSTSSPQLLDKEPGSAAKPHSSTASRKLIFKKPGSTEESHSSISSPKLLSKVPGSAEKPHSSASIDENIPDVDLGLPRTGHTDFPNDCIQLNNELEPLTENIGLHIVNTPTRSSQCKKATDLSSRGLQQHVWRLQKQVLKLKKENQTIRSTVNRKLSFLSAEQRKFLLSGKKNKEYTPEMIKDALQIRYAVGWKGYKYLVQKGFPLPSYSTICRKMQSIDFRPGLLHDILFYLQIKSKSCTPKEKDCMLMIDEMEICKGLELMPGMKKYVGNCTLGKGVKKEEVASQLLVVMIRGLNTNWKQVIGYHLLDKTNKDDTLADFVKEAIAAVHESGYNVRGFVSDMGPKNQAIWRSLGLYPGRFCKTFDVAHPVNKDDRLFVFADAPHLLKNLKQALLTHTITIPEETMTSEKLTYNTVDSKYLRDLVRIQKDMNLKLAPKLTQRHLDPNQFEKMKVSMATQVFCDKTASALETLVKLDLMSKKALTTAWFLRKIRSWVDIINSREKKNGITRKTKLRKIKALKNIVSLFKVIKIGDGHWKPVQTGVILTTTNLIAILHTLFSEGYGYILTSRLNQDALESLFSVLRRHGNNHPSALQSIQALKLITVSQFIEKRSERSQNYDCDSDEHYVALFSNKNRPMKEQATSSAIAQCCRKPDGSLDSSDDEPSPSLLSPAEQNALNNLLGAAIQTVLQRNQLCPSCKEDVVKPNSSGRLEETVIDFRNKGGLIYPSEDMFNQIQLAEEIVRKHLKSCKLHDNLLEHLVLKVNAKTISQAVGLKCLVNCRATEVITRQFIRVRLHIHSTHSKETAKLASRKKCFASKSANREISIPYELSLLGYVPPATLDA